MAEDTLVQVWNSRSKFWVLIDTGKKGGIKDHSKDKFDGVPVKSKNSDPDPDPDPEQEKPQKNESEEDGADKGDTDKSSRKGPFGFLFGR